MGRRILKWILIVILIAGTGFFVYKLIDKNNSCSINGEFLSSKQELLDEFYLFKSDFGNEFGENVYKFGVLKDGYSYFASFVEDVTFKKSDAKKLKNNYANLKKDFTNLEKSFSSAKNYLKEGNPNESEKNQRIEKLNQDYLTLNKDLYSLNCFLETFYKQNLLIENLYDNTTCLFSLKGVMVNANLSTGKNFEILKNFSSFVDGLAFNYSETILEITKAYNEKAYSFWCESFVDYFDSGKTNDDLSQILSLIERGQNEKG